METLVKPASQIMVELRVKLGKNFRSDNTTFPKTQYGNQCFSVCSPRYNTGNWKGFEIPLQISITPRGICDELQLV